MADRTDLPRIKPDKQPTYFNREAGGWGYLGAFVGSIIGGLIAGPEMWKNIQKGIDKVPSKALVIGFAGEALGIVYGALKGKTRQEREQREGRVVKDPTYWNSGFFSGAMVAGIATIPLTVMHYAGKTKGNGLLHLAGAIGWVGAIAGMVMRKDDMQRDYDQAVGIRNQQIGMLQNQMHTLQQTTQPGVHPLTPPVSFMNSVSAEESAELAAKQDHKKPGEHHSHAEKAHAGHADKPHHEHASHAEKAHHEKHEAGEAEAAR